MFYRAPIACPPEELADAEATVSGKRTHTKLQGQSRGGSIVSFGRSNVRGGTMWRGLAEEQVGPRFVTAFSALARKHHGSGAQLPRLLHPICEEMRLAELQSAHRVQGSDTGGCITGPGLSQPGDAFLDASRGAVY